MPLPTRPHMEALYEIFDAYTLGDQRLYYQKTLRRYRDSSQQVNQIRAFFSLLTGFASALAGLLVQAACTRGGCATAEQTMTSLGGGLNFLVGVLLILAVVAPALGGAFGTLADLYQWDRLVTIYEASLDNVEVADSRSPDPEMDDDLYWASLKAYTTGTLNVMRDETAQWGQLIRTPEQLDEFIRQAKERADAAEKEGPAAKHIAQVKSGQYFTKAHPSDPITHPEEPNVAG